MSFLAGNGLIGSVLDKSGSNASPAASSTASDAAGTAASPSFNLSGFAKNIGNDALDSVAGNYIGGYNKIKSGNTYEGIKDIFRGGSAQPSMLDKYRRRY